MAEQSPDVQSEVIFAEQGASWLWLLGGPIAAGAMLFNQLRAGLGFAPLVPLGFLVVISAVLALQVRAARIHTSVELTREALREGTETILLDEIAEVYQEEPKFAKRGETPEPWQSARSLGELNGIPKGRKAIGLRLTNKRTAQAWARKHELLRAELTRLVEARAAEK